MSRSRQPAGPEVRTASVTYAAGLPRWRGQASEWGRLMFVSRGMLTVHTDAGMWFVPPHQAIWIPPRISHDIELAGRVALRWVYFDKSLLRSLPRTCQLVDVSPLLREILRRAMKLKTLDKRDREERNLMRVLVDQVVVLPHGPVDLPAPRDARAVRAASLVRAAPDVRHSLTSVARESGASARTLERLFRTETGLPFGAWCQRARLLRALQVLADGATVTAAAIAVGYESTSAFVAAFRRLLGTTPGQYFKAVAGDDETEPRRTPRSRR